MSELDRELARLLFGNPNRRLVHLGLYLGDAENITAEDVKRELVGSLQRREQSELRGSAEAPRSRQPAIDVREWVADLERDTAH